MTSPVNESLYKNLSTSVATGFAALWLAGDHFLGSSVSPQSLSDWLKIGSSAAGSAFFAFFVFRSVFEQWLWRWRIFQGWLVLIPDLSGVWSGDLYSITYNDRFYNVVEIRHKFDRLLYSSSRRGQNGGIVSREEDIVCDVRRAESEKVELIVVYRNEPGQMHNNDGYTRPHEACAVMVLIDGKCKKTDWKLGGQYWTNKHWPGAPSSDNGATRGEITLTWKASLAAFHANKNLQDRLYEPTRPSPKINRTAEPTTPA
jgi:hypothetical protein